MFFQNSSQEKASGKRKKLWKPECRAFSPVPTFGVGCPPSEGGTVPGPKDTPWNWEFSSAQFWPVGNLKLNLLNQRLRYIHSALWCLIAELKSLCKGKIWSHCLPEHKLLWAIRQHWLSKCHFFWSAQMPDEHINKTLYWFPLKVVVRQVARTHLGSFSSNFENLFPAPGHCHHHQHG